jgi:hypothetical protein
MHVQQGAVSRARKCLRAGMLVVLGAIFCFAMTGIYACGDNSQSVIRQGLTQELDEPKDLTSDTMTSLASQLSSSGLDGTSLLAAWFDGYDYKINDITVNGSSATADVTVTVKQIGPLYDQVYEDIMNTAQDPSNAGITQSDLMSQFSDELLSDLQGATPTATDLQLTCTLNGNEWSVDNPDTALYPAMYGQSQYLSYNS